MHQPINQVIIMIVCADLFEGSGVLATAPMSHSLTTLLSW